MRPIEPTEAVSALVIGGGPAGLAAALTLSRALQTTHVLDPATPPRNAASPGIGALLGRDGFLPADLRALGRSEIERYGYATFSSDSAVAIEGDATTGFEVSTASGQTLAAKTVLIACGMVDLFPDIDGLADYWGTNIINCPFCHGFELKGKAWGVVCDRPEMLDAAEIYAEWTDDLMFFVNPSAPPSPDRREALLARGFKIEARPIRQIIGNAGTMTAVAVEGDTIARDALVLWPRQRHTAIVERLELALAEDGGLAVDAGFRTTRQGVYAAGDVLYSGHQNVSTAIHMGNLAAATMVMDLAKSTIGTEATR